MTDREHFAAAALTGLLVHANDGIDEETLDTPSDIAYTAYQMADAMLRERERIFDAKPRELSDDQKTLRNAASLVGPGGFKNLANELLSLSRRLTNHDAAPVARARTDADSARTDKAAPRPGAGTGDTTAQGSVQGEGSVRDSRNAKEPVAWAVETGGELEASFCGPAWREDAADWREQSDGVIVPLYRHPQPTFTDEEWEAVDRLMRDYQAAGLALDANVADRLRGLLERTK